MKKAKKKTATLFNLGFPIFIQSLLMNLLHSLDTLMIGAYNENMVISINNATSVMMMVNVLLIICSTGVGIVISQYLGAKMQDDAKKTFNNGLMFNLALAIVLFILMITLQKPLLQMIACPEEYLNDAMSYLAIVALGIPFNAVVNVISANLRSHQRPGVMTIIAVTSNLLNVFLNYCLIFGHLGMPEMGIRGAAIATVTSEGLSLIVALILLPALLHDKVYSFRISMPHLKKVLYIGLPSALENFCYTISTLFVTAAVNQLTKAEMLARTYINMIMTYIYQFSVAFGQANAILVGYDIGRGQPKEAKKKTYKSFIYCYPILLVIIIALNIWGKDLIGIIVKDMGDVDLILEASIKILPWIFLYETGRCVNLIFINSLKATGDVVFPLICAIFSMFFFSSLGSWVLGIYLHLGFLGIFLAQAFDECFRAVIMIWRWQSDRWTNKSIIKA